MTPGPEVVIFSPLHYRYQFPRSINDLLLEVICDGVNTLNHLDNSVAWHSTQMAVQQGLGLRTKRRNWSDTPDRLDPSLVEDHLDQLHKSDGFSERRPSHSL